MFLAWLFGQAFAQDFATMIVVRFFGGGASSIVINCVGGTITDLWETAGERSLPMSLYGMTSVVGIALGPFIGGAIQRNLDWRWYVFVRLWSSLYPKLMGDVGSITFKLLLMVAAFPSSGSCSKRREVILSSKIELRR